MKIPPAAGYALVEGVPMDDAQAIERCKRGEREAFSLLVRRYQAEAIGHAIAILRHREDALDAVQEAFLRAFRAIDRLRDGRAFYPWFYTILRNHCFTRLAQRRRRRHVALEAEQMILAADDDTAAAEELEMLERALAELSAEDRELIVLKHLDGLRYGPIAERLGIPPGTVMSRLYHARRRLRDELLRIRRAREGQGASHE